MLFGILGANRTEDLFVARNEIVSSYYYFFPHILSGRFLRDDLMDLLEIFRDCRHWSGIEILEPDF